MPSLSYAKWVSTRASELDEMSQAHAAVGGTARGRRYATQQINRAFAVLLASQFQGFCRELHSECVSHIVTVIAPAPSLRNLVLAEFTRGRQLDRGNAKPSSLGADFDRLGINLWDELKSLDPRSEDWREEIDLLNDWRNAIAHQDFDSAKLNGIINLRLARVRAWRSTCEHLARAMDDVLRQHLQGITELVPW